MVTMLQPAEQAVARALGPDGDTRRELPGRTPPVVLRRWTWALAAAACGAVAGAVAVLLVRRVVGADAADAQEPDELVAVIDPGTSPS